MDGIGPGPPVGRAIYAFDVDDTLEVSGGPVTLEMVQRLRFLGEIVGICGNWPVVTRSIPWWASLFSFLGPFVLGGEVQPKEDFLIDLKTYCPARDYVMVGNDPRFFGVSSDAEAARLAGWRFVLEREFAAGQR